MTTKAKMPDTSKPQPYSAADLASLEGKHIPLELVGIHCTRLTATIASLQSENERLREELRLCAESHNVGL